MKKFQLIVLSLILFCTFPVAGAKLMLRIHPEYRQLAVEGKGDWLKIWNKYGIEAPKPCFPRHAPLAEKERESGFGPADLSLWYQAEIPEKLKSAFFLQEVQRLPFFRYVEWKNEASIPLSMPGDPAADSSSGAQRQVLRKIQAYAAWALTQGDTSVVIGLLDTGTPIAHEDIAGNLKLNLADPVNGTDDDGNGLTDDYSGWDFGSGDNNPTPDNNGTSPGHGTSVSSLAGASTDNDTGIAGIGWKCRILPVKIWKWAGSFSNFMGYEAIVYAADMGCKVINCSWGSPGAGTQYEQDIIQYATFNKRALVVAAGGNTAGYYQFLPANYNYAFGVSMTDTSDRIFWAASRHFKLDIMAPGVGVYGIKTNGSYGWVEGGTSMASPMVAGAAGLVLSRFPNLSGLQAGELLRVNSDTIYSLPGNAGYRDQTGRGRLNIHRALTAENRISLRAADIVPEGLARPGDTLRFGLRFENYLESVPGFSVKLYCPAAEFSLLQQSATMAALGSMQEMYSGPVFSGLVSSALSGRKEISIRADVQAGNYRDSRWFTISLNPGWITLDSNQIEISMAENGRLGTADLAGYFGRGIRYRGIQLSSDAGLILGTAPGKVSNCVFGSGSADQHFKAENRPAFQDWPQLDQHAVFHFNDSLAGVQSSGIAVKQSAYECTSDSLQSVVFISYQLTNHNAFALDSLCAGIYNDWDVDVPDLNICRWVDSLQLGYTRGFGVRNLLAATMALEAEEPQFFAIDARPDTAGNNINLFDGFSAAEKWKTLSSGIARRGAGGSSGGNVVQVCAQKLRNFQAGETRKVAFALLFADSLTDLYRKAGQARRFFRKMNESPVPPPRQDFFCEGDTLLVQPPPDMARLRVFADSLSTVPLFSGSGFQARISSDSVLFVSSADSLAESARMRWQWQRIERPAIALSCLNCSSGDTITSPWLLQLASAGEGSADWYFNGSPQPSLSGSDTITAQLNPADSVQEICLERTSNGCQSRICRTFRIWLVNHAALNEKAELSSLLYLPEKRTWILLASEPGIAELRDVQGRSLGRIITENGQNILPAFPAEAGIYFLRVSGKSEGNVYRIFPHTGSSIRLTGKR